MTTTMTTSTTTTIIIWRRGLGLSAPRPTAPPEKNTWKGLVQDL
eukprot:CAMPEP_0171605468 /NCGR_PEP_ID=MMETSP0990-20121206/7208_1 /TAXON_ID=483369 /ORGANISM="non described non described, Strain CCMP2098" /LENGTH=43 /DNA_ID= /DNA_START= /DNA_END= /DNA_ORIENTATION=